MRNPYFVDVRIEGKSIFASKGKDDKSVVVQAFDLHGDKIELSK